MENIMALPSIDAPTYEIEIPHTKETKKFRPFLVKEEKLLVLANESGEHRDMIRATQQIVTNCSFGEIDGEKLPLFALQKIFLDIRSQSISSVIDLVLSCGSCEAQNAHSIDLATLEIEETEGHSTMVKLSDTLFIEMQYPDPFQVSELLDTSDPETVYRIAGNCVSVIYDGDEKYNAFESSEDERRDWVEQLTLEQFVNLRKFFETMPVLEHAIDFDCVKCGKANYINFNGYQDFFV